MLPSAVKKQYYSQSRKPIICSTIAILWLQDKSSAIAELPIGLTDSINLYCLSDTRVSEVLKYFFLKKRGKISN